MNGLMERRNWPMDRALPAQQSSPTELSRAGARAGTRAQPNAQPGHGEGSWEIQDPLRALSSKLFCFLKNIMKTKLGVPPSSDREHFLNLHRYNNATVSIILNQLNCLSCAPEEELIIFQEPARAVPQLHSWENLNDQFEKS